MDHLGFLVTRASLFHSLRAACGDVLKQTPVRPAAQEILTQGDKGSEVRDSVGREMVELSSEEVQKSTEKGMWGQGKTAVDMSGE